MLSHSSSRVPVDGRRGSTSSTWKRTGSLFPACFLAHGLGQTQLWQSDYSAPIPGRLWLVKNELVYCQDLQVFPVNIASHRS